MGSRRLWKVLGRIACSLLCAGVFYFAWMAVFLLTGNPANPVAKTILWLLAPVTTATGFAVGITLFERLAGKSRPAFGMFLAGTASVALREVSLWRAWEE
jgi:hypothetical protein